MTSRRPKGRQGPTGTGYRYWMLDGVGNDRIPGGQQRLPVHEMPPGMHAASGLKSSAARSPATSLLGPYSLLPWGRGWQTATCRAGGVPAAADCDCGIVFFPTMDNLVRFLLPKPKWRAGRALQHLPQRARLSMALGRITTGGDWQLDEGTSCGSAYRVPTAKLEELWLSPGALRSADAVGAEYGVPTHGGTGTYTEWLRSLVPWGDAIAGCTPELETPRIQPPKYGDVRDLVRYMAESRSEAERVRALGQALLAQVRAASDSARQTLFIVEMEAIPRDERDDEIADLGKALTAKLPHFVVRRWLKADDAAAIVIGTDDRASCDAAESLTGWTHGRLTLRAA